ncbi:hypothetical protein UAJ10_02205 [Nitrospirillum sp. BR 11164]|uniref:hypothetical protein n=1 Tax=Nitrospirillum sp. BR 11164 TaxID=3104324 RepID=UPI002AFEDC10|nr:hypothetical protein [Nitrospirillum sp. BR 11164]MEA1647832.1 hypothetical protein [Nitrospirillum sp. BR 11164]
MAQLVNGYLLFWPGSPGNIKIEDLSQSSNLRIMSNERAYGWDFMEFKSNIPLDNEDHGILSPPYLYKIMCRRSGPRVLLLSTGKKIVDVLIEKEINTTLSPNLRPAHLKINDLVHLIVKSPDRYLLTSVYCRTPAYGADLQSLSMFGDDVGNAELFREIMDRMTAYRCGLGRLRDRKEIVRLGSDGAISFFWENERRAKEVESTLNYLKNNNLIETDWNEVLK